MTNYLYTRYDHYKKFLEKYGSDRLHKGLKIIPAETKFKDLMIASGLYKPNLNEEIFNNPIETEYIFKDFKYGKKAIFKTKSSTEYRLDIFSINEKDKNQIVNHISFTINDDKFDNMPNSEEEFNIFDYQYNTPTGKKELYEVLNRIRFILKDLVDKNSLNNYFCVGGTKFGNKNNIYEYFLKIVVGEDGFEKLPTSVYPSIGWGLYFSI